MNWKISIHAERFHGADEQTDKIEYIEQNFRKQSDTADASSEGDPMQAIGSFVLDESYGFTQAGAARINNL